jgi:hypothetical protein
VRYRIRFSGDCELARAETCGALTGHSLSWNPGSQGVALGWHVVSPSGRNSKIAQHQNSRVELLTRECVSIGGMHRRSPRAQTNPKRERGLVCSDCPTVRGLAYQPRRAYARHNVRTRIAIATRAGRPVQRAWLADGGVPHILDRSTKVCAATEYGSGTAPLDEVRDRSRGSVDRVFEAVAS